MRQTLLPAEMGEATGWVTIDAALTPTMSVDVVISLGRLVAASASFFWLPIKASSTAFSRLNALSAPCLLKLKTCTAW